MPELNEVGGARHDSTYRRAGSIGMEGGQYGWPEGQRKGVARRWCLNRINRGSQTRQYIPLCWKYREYMSEEPAR